MKKIFLASLIAISSISALPTKKNCNCTNCTCNAENHCGCFSEGGCPWSNQVSQVEEKAQESNIAEADIPVEN